MSRGLRGLSPSFVSLMLCLVCILFGCIRKPLRLYVFDCGTLKTVLSRFNLQPNEVASQDLSVSCFLIDHPQGKLMWDVGAVPDEEWMGGASEVQHHLVLPDSSERNLILKKHLLPQLAELGYSPADITHLAFSHYHWDHTANANAFARAKWFVRGVERGAMFGDKPVNARPSTYAALRDAETVIINEDEYDVFGDGMVVLKAAPGHTPGHQVLYIKLPQTGGVVLAGDLYHFPESRTLKRITTFEFDPQQTPRSREVIEAFLQTTGAQLWIQHDYIGNSRLKKSPEYYE
jgi:N-acyl homoserine lactone hydrolase